MARKRYSGEDALKLLREIDVHLHDGLSTDQQAEVEEKLSNGEAISAIARQFGTSRQTIMRVRDNA